MDLRKTVAVIVALGAIIGGFCLATQAGMGWPNGFIQNDGYAMSGGLLILLGGMVLGYALAKQKRRTR